ncbi:tetratricopeptide repeat protein [Nitrospira sp. Nam80]
MKYRLINRVLLLGLSILLSDCTSAKEDGMKYEQGIYKETLERQKAGLAIKEEEPTPLPNMGSADYERLGDSHFQNGNWALAVVEYSKALEGHTAPATIHYKLGLVSLKQGLGQEALARLQEAVKLAPKFSLAHEGLGQAYWQSGNYDLAEGSFRHGIELEPSRWQTHNWLGMLLDRKKRHQEAIAEYQAALALRPQESAVHNNLGLAYYFTGEYDRAIRAFEEAVRNGATLAKVHNNLAMAYGKAGRFADAWNAFKRAGDEAQAYNNLGTVYMDLGKNRQAVICFEKALEQAPRYYVAAAENLQAAQRAVVESSSLNHDSDNNGASSCP